MKLNKKSLVKVAILSAILGLNGMCFDNMINAAEVAVDVGYQSLVEREKENRRDETENIEEPYCTICCENNANVKTTCSHTFCAECLEKWLQEHETCPCCRAIIRPKQKERKDPALEQAKKDKDNKERALLLNKLAKATKGLPETTRMQFIKDMQEASKVVGYEMDIVAKIKKTLDAGETVPQDLFEELHLQNDIKNNIIDSWRHDLTNVSKNPVSDEDVEAMKVRAVEKTVAELRNIHDKLLKQALKAGDHGDYALQDRLMEQVGNIETNADELGRKNDSSPEQVAYELNEKEKEHAYEMAQIVEIGQSAINNGDNNQYLRADITQAQNEYYNITGTSWTPENPYINNTCTNYACINYACTNYAYTNSTNPNNYANYNTNSYAYNNTTNYTNYSNNCVQPQPIWNNQFADNRQMVYVY